MIEISEEQLKEIYESKNKCMLGKHVVDVKKVTPFQYKKIMGVINQLPTLLVNTFYNLYNSIDIEEETDILHLFMLSGNVALDELIHVTNILTNIDEDTILNEVPIEDLVLYLHKLIKYNSLDKAIKNYLSPLLKRVKEIQQ